MHKGKLTPSPGRYDFQPIKWVWGHPSFRLICSCYPYIYTEKTDSIPWQIWFSTDQMGMGAPMFPVDLFVLSLYIHRKNWLRHMAAMFYNSENLLGHLRTICTKFFWNRTKRHLQTIYVEGIVQILRIKCPKIRSFQISKMAVMTVVCSYFLNYFKWHLISNHMLDWTETCGYTKIYNCYMAWNDPVEIRIFFFLKAI